MTAIDALRERPGDRVTTDRGVLQQHSRGQDSLPAHLPDTVAFAETGRRGRVVLAVAHQHRVPVIPVRGGISLNVSRMTRIVETNSGDMDCRIEAGVTREQLNTHLRDQGLFFPVDPGANCTRASCSTTHPRDRLERRMLRPSR